MDSEKLNYLMGFAMHTTFLPRENLHFLEEWILYHMYLGAEHIYLYDNTGSVQQDCDHSVSVDGMNKYGIPIVELTADLSDAEIAKWTEKIVARFSPNVTLIPWAPKVDGRVVYGQGRSIKDCLQKFGKRHEWMGFFDMDEFVVSPAELSMNHIFDEANSRQATRLLVYQKKFEDRFVKSTRCGGGHILVSEIFDCINRPMFRSKKLFLKCAVFDENVRTCNVHKIPVRSGNDWSMPMDILRFNHYNLNPAQSEWLMSFLEFTREEAFLHDRDEGMSRAVSILREHPFEAGFGKFLGYS